jgi:thioester reductase-like protein
MGQVFITGATGYIGTHAAVRLVRRPDTVLAPLVRAPDPRRALERLWHTWQLEMDAQEFAAHVEAGRIRPVCGELTDPGLGLSPAVRQRLVEETTSVLHIAASLNRRSAKACFNVNLRGTLEVLQLARAMQDHHPLRRFTDVSTVAVAGPHQDACIAEDDMVDWDRSDYDPYARTKKFCEHMLQTLLPDVPHAVVRPSTVLGDSRHPRTFQFDMVRAFVWLAQAPLLPLDPAWRMDIVPVNWVADAMVAVHSAPVLAQTSFNLSAGPGSESYGTLLDGLMAAGAPRRPLFVPRWNRTSQWLFDQGATAPRGWPITGPAALLKVFWPYLSNNTVFDNAHTLALVGRAPASFSTYAWPLFRFAADGGFTFPHQPWPGPMPMPPEAA